MGIFSWGKNPVDEMTMDLDLRSASRRAEERSLDELALGQLELAERGDGRGHPPRSLAMPAQRRDQPGGPGTGVGEHRVQRLGLLDQRGQGRRATGIGNRRRFGVVGMGGMAHGPPRGGMTGAAVVVGDGVGADPHRVVRWQQRRVGVQRLPAVGASAGTAGHRLRRGGDAQLGEAEAQGAAEVRRLNASRTGVPS